MAEEIEVLCGRISLFDREKEEISISEGEIAVLRERGSRCLVGRIGTEKRINREAFRTLLTRLWRPLGQVIFQAVQEHLWIFEFSDGDDKRRVMEGRPWLFDRYILILNEFDGSKAPTQMEFLHSPLWVQVHDMPLIYMSKEVGRKISSSLGECLEVDVAGNGGGWGRWLRIRVNLDLTQPLERGRALNFNGQTSWVSFKYEKLPLFCFKCGRILHGSNGCSVRIKHGVNADGTESQWGAWLRADAPKTIIGGGRAARLRRPLGTERYSTVTVGSTSIDINDGAEHTDALRSKTRKAVTPGNSSQSQPTSTDNGSHNNDSIKRGVADDGKRATSHKSGVSPNNFHARNPFVFNASKDISSNRVQTGTLGVGPTSVMSGRIVAQLRGPQRLAHARMLSLGLRRDFPKRVPHWPILLLQAQVLLFHFNRQLQAFIWSQPFPLVQVGVMFLLRVGNVMLAQGARTLVLQELPQVLYASERQSMITV